MQSKLWFVKLFLTVGLPMLIIGITLIAATLYVRRRHISRKMKHSMSKVEIEHLMADVKVNQILNKQINDNGFLDKEGILLELKMKIRRVNRELNTLYKDFDSRIKLERITTTSIINDKVIESIDRSKYPKLYKHFSDKKVLMIKRNRLVNKLDEVLIDPNAKLRRHFELNYEITLKAITINEKDIITNALTRYDFLFETHPDISLFDKYSISKSHFLKLTGSAGLYSSVIPTYLKKQDGYLKRKSMDLNRDLKDYETRLNDLHETRLKY